MIYIPILKLLLVLTNIGILLLLLNLISIHLKDRNNIKSFSTAFHVLSLVWLCIRGSFWTLSIISTTSWDVSTFYLLYWMPCPFQFSSFMLLPLFFSQKLYPAKWKEYWNYSINVYITIIVVLIVFQIVWTFVAAFRMKMISTLCENDSEDNDDGAGQLTPAPTAPPTLADDCYHTEYAGNTFRVIAAVCSLLLAIMQGLYGYKLANTDSKSHHEQFIISNQTHLGIVNIFLVLSFLSRGVYQLRALQHNYLLPDIPLQGDDDVSLTTFICFEIWDYIPTILLLMTVTSKSIVRHNNFVPTISLKSEPIRIPGLTYPQYGALYDEDDEWKSVSVASPLETSVETTSFLLEGSSASDATTKKSVLRNSFSVNQYPPPRSLERFEAPSSLTPSSTWLNATIKDETFTRNPSFPGTPSNSLENQEKGLMMYYKPYRNREGSVGSDTSNPSDSGRSTLRKKLVSVGDEPQSPKDIGLNILHKTFMSSNSIGGQSQKISDNIRIERSGTIEKDSKAIPSPVSSPKFNVRNNIVDTKNKGTKELATPIPTRSFQFNTTNTNQPNSKSNNSVCTNNVDRRFEMKKRESKSVIPDM